jgi:hypothetical protein
MLRLTVAASLLGRLPPQILGGVWISLMQLTLQLAGTGIASRTIIIGMLFGSCGNVLRSAMHLPRISVVSA